MSLSIQSMMDDFCEYFERAFKLTDDDIPQLDFRTWTRMLNIATFYNDQVNRNIIQVIGVSNLVDIINLRQVSVKEALKMCMLAFYVAHPAYQSACAMSGRLENKDYDSPLTAAMRTV